MNQVDDVFRVTEHPFHVSYSTHIPGPNGMVEFRILEHIAHVSYITHIPGV